MFTATIFDMDGTLSDPTHRRPFIEGVAKKNWAAWNERMGDDPPNVPIAALARILHQQGTKVLVCTGRHERYRRVTETWLLLHDVPVHKLYMRPDTDNRSDFIVKRELLDAIRADGFDPQVVVDDRASVVAMWREAGLTCLQCAPGDF
jgi:beta-phosphoglucomutase-like phosphatase (HAD superfamily)